MAEIYNEYAASRANVLSQDFGEMENLLSAISFNKSQMNSKIEDMEMLFRNLNSEGVWDPSVSETMSNAFKQQDDALLQCVETIDRLYNVISQIYSNNKQLHAKWTSLAYTKNDSSEATQNTQTRIGNEQSAFYTAVQSYGDVFKQ